MNAEISFAQFLSVIGSLELSLVGLLVLCFFALVFSAYIKIVTVLGIVRVGFGVGGLPSAFVTSGLALVLTFFVMMPTIVGSIGKVHGVSPGENSAVKGSLQAANRFEAGLSRWKEFLQKHSRAEEVEKFSLLARNLEAAGGHPESDITDKQIASLRSSWQVLAPAFVVSQLKEAFQTGLSVFLPFLVIDLLLANVLVAVGLSQINPLIVSFPFKLLLFVMVDGWILITTNLVQTYA
ncbi:MAG: EscR/YscR/HrcR family type III secretion system export apparatus protein [Deltaproteobacteria bacterium]|nr:EscR/YscR/HrcR family type III secretion system export apparatus protein [Deltaproteobacteria bacterium]